MNRGIEVHELSVRRGDRTVLRDVSFDAPRGKVLALVGASGAGKSTLLRCLNRLAEPAAGTIALDGEDIRAVAPQVLRRRVALVAQAPVMLPGTVADNLAYALDALDDDIRDAALAAAGLDGTFLPRTARALSGGERARVALARALTRDPDAILLDEPTAALDPETAQVIAQTVAALAHRDLAVIVATHDMTLAESVADATLRLVGGAAGSGASGVRAGGPRAELAGGAGAGGPGGNARGRGACGRSRRGARGRGGRGWSRRGARGRGGRGRAGRGARERGGRRPRPGSGLGRGDARSGGARCRRGRRLSSGVLQVACGVAFVGLAALLAHRLELGLSREILIAAARAIVQLAAVGALIALVFRVDVLAIAFVAGDGRHGGASPAAGGSSRSRTRGRGRSPRSASLPSARPPS